MHSRFGMHTVSLCSRLSPAPTQLAVRALEGAVDGAIFQLVQPVKYCDYSADDRRKAGKENEQIGFIFVLHG